jgi:uncharacterized protein
MGYIKYMIDAPSFSSFSGFTWDPAKCAKNIENHGIDFAVVYDFVFSTALIRTDDRFDYGEVREIALGFIGERLHVLVFTRRAPNLHVISLRKANERERNFYGTR